MERGVRWRAVAVAALFSMLAAGAHGQGLPCEPSDGVKKAFLALPDASGSAEASVLRTKALGVLRDRFPRDVWVHQRYQDALRFEITGRDAVVAEYDALARKHPGDPLFAYLAARVRIGSNTKDLIPELERTAAAVPPARLSLADIYQAPAFRDAAKARAQLEAFMTACPSSLQAAPSLRSLQPSDFLTRATAALRKELARRTDPQSLVHYSTLWSLEFRLKPASEHDALRKQVAQDLARLRKIDPGKSQSYYSVLQTGYKLVEDRDGVKWTADQVRLRFPANAYYTVSNEWREANPYPKASDPPEKRRAYYEAQKSVALEWARQWPDQTTNWFNLVGAMVQLENVPASEVETAGEELLRSVAKNPGQMSFMSPTGGSSFALVVAHLYASKGVRLDRLPDLVRDGLAELELPSRTAGPPSDLYPRPADMEESNRSYNEWYGALTVADVWIKARDAAQALPALNRVRTVLDRAKPKGEVDPKDTKQVRAQGAFLERQRDYWQRMAGLAELQGRKVDAMTFYQNALLARAAAGVKPPAGDGDKLAVQARALWKDLGGSTEGWVAWNDRGTLLGGLLPGAAREAAWDNTERALPEFDLVDLAGGKWRLSDFKGKTTLINVWGMT